MGLLSLMEFMSSPLYASLSLFIAMLSFYLFSFSSGKLVVTTGITLDDKNKEDWLQSKWFFFSLFLVVVGCSYLILGVVQISWVLMTIGS